MAGAQGDETGSNGLTRAEVERFFAVRERAWLAKDLDAYMSLWSEDVEFTTPDAGDTIHGRDALRAFIGANFAAPGEPASLSIDHYAIDGSVLLQEWTLVTQAEGGSEPHVLRGMAVCGFRNGRVIWWRDYYSHGLA
jgi:hypothetical protein